MTSGYYCAIFPFCGGGKKKDDKETKAFYDWATTGIPVITLACIACLCFETGVCPWPDLSSLFQYTSPTPIVSLHLIPRIQYHPGIPVTLLTGSI